MEDICLWQVFPNNICNETLRNSPTLKESLTLHTAMVPKEVSISYFLFIFCSEKLAKRRQLCKYKMPKLHVKYSMKFKNQNLKCRSYVILFKIKAILYDLTSYKMHAYFQNADTAYCSWKQWLTPEIVSSSWTKELVSSSFNSNDTKTL